MEPLMGVETAVATAAGVGAAGTALLLDQNLAMAAAGGAAFFLAVSVAIPMQTRFFFGIGSLILGYIVGIAFLSYGQWSALAAFAAFLTSALGSGLFGSLHGWVNGGVQPGWVTFLTKLLPFSWKKGGDGTNE